MANDKAIELLKEMQINLAEVLDALGGGDTVTLPETLEEINDLEKGAALALAKGLHLDISDLKVSQVKELLATAHNILNLEDTDDLDEDAVNALAESVGIKPSKKLAATVAALKEYFEVTPTEAADDEETEEEETSEKEEGDEEEEETEEETEEEADEEEEEEKPKGKKKSKVADEDEEEATDEEEGEKETEEEEATEDEVDRVAIAKKAKLPKESVMVSRLKLFNSKAPKDQRIKDANTEKAYRKLLALLIDSDGEIAEWGRPYIANQVAMCCGLELAEVKHKGAQRGTCVVTDKLFELGEEGFEEVETEEAEEEEEETDED